MPLIHLSSKTLAESDNMRRDFFKIETAINSAQQILDLQSRSSDPNPDDTSGKIQIWYRSDLKEIRFNDNGTVYKIAATPA